MKSIWVFLLGTAITLFFLVTQLIGYWMAVDDESPVREAPSPIYAIGCAAIILLGIWARYRGYPGLANLLVMLPAILVFGIFGFLIVVFNLKSILGILALIAAVAGMIWYIQFVGRNGMLRRVFDASRAIAQQREADKANRMNKGEISLKNEGEVSFSQEGIGGYVHFKSKEGRFNMYWEFGGGNVVASISVPNPEQWVAQTGIPLERRAAVLDYIGRVTVQKQTRNGSFKLEGSSIVIYDK